MLRFLIVVMILGGAVSLARAQSTRPATRLVNPRTLSSDELKTLEREAYELMKLDQYAKAGPKLDLVYAAIPQAQQSRATVMNHAILDLVQIKYAMRGVRDLTDYLKRNRGEDEPATNLLGIGLNLTADNPKVKAGALWQTAFKEWDRRNYLLDHSRPGIRRWGTRWVTDDEHKAQDAQKESLKQAIAAQAERLSRAELNVNSLNQQQYNAQQAQWRYSVLGTYMQQGNSAQNLINQLQQGQFDPNNPFGNSGTIGGSSIEQERLNAWMSANELAGDLRTAITEMQAEQARLNDLIKQRDAVRPDWPKRFDPVDPDAPAPAPTTAPTAASILGTSGSVGRPATQPAGAAAPPQRRPSPDDLYAQPRED